MTTTLIVRDATLAINGAPEKRDEPRAHLRLRVAEVTHMDPRTAQECVEVLTSVAVGEGADVEALEALVIVGLAQPKLAESLGLATVALGRKLSTLYERGAQVDHSVAVLELLQQSFPGQESIERDLGLLMRRQGMVNDLVGRYYERAKKLMREGRNAEAAGWLREVLQLDPTRKDAARLMRDLRIKRTAGLRKHEGGWRKYFVLLLFVLGAAYAGLRERRLRAEFEALPDAVPGNEASIERRLKELTRFQAAHPIWHGGLGVLSEQSSLRLELAVLAEKVNLAREAEERAAKERLESAEFSRQRGLLLAQAGDLRGALSAFLEAMEYGGDAWEHRARVARDVSDLEASLKDQP
jgi:tetratricopeptide (TPR) repeat protein